MFSRFLPVPAPGSDETIDKFVKDARKRIAAARWAPANARRVTEDLSDDSPSEDSATEDENDVVPDEMLFKYSDPPPEMLALRPGLNSAVDAAVAKVQASRLEPVKPVPLTPAVASVGSPLSSAVCPSAAPVHPTEPCGWDRQHPLVVASVAKVQDARLGNANATVLDLASLEPPNPAINVLSRVLSHIDDYKCFGERSAAAHAVFLSAKEEAEKLTANSAPAVDAVPIVAPPASDSEDVGNDADAEAASAATASVTQSSALPARLTRASDEVYATEEARNHRAAVLFAQHVLARHTSQASDEKAALAVLDKASVSFGPLRIANPYFAGAYGGVPPYLADSIAKLPNGVPIEHPGIPSLEIGGYVTQLVRNHDAGVGTCVFGDPSRVQAATIGYFLSVLRDQRKCWGPVLFVVPAAYLRLWHWTLAAICPTFNIVGYYGERGYIATVRRALKGQISDVGTPASPAHILLCTYQSFVKDNGTIASLGPKVAVFHALTSIDRLSHSSGVTRVLNKLVSLNIPSRLAVVPITPPERIRTKKKPDMKGVLDVMEWLLPKPLHDIPEAVYSDLKTALGHVDSATSKALLRLLQTQLSVTIHTPFYEAIVYDKRLLAADEGLKQQYADYDVGKAVAVITTCDGINAVVQFATSADSVPASMRAKARPDPIDSVVKSALVSASAPASGKRHPVYYLVTGKGTVQPIKSKYKQITRKINRWVYESKGVSLGTFGSEAEAAAAVAQSLGLPDAPLREKLLMKNGELVTGLEGDPLPEIEGGEEGVESAVKSAKRAAPDAEKDQRTMDILASRKWRAQPLMERLQTLKPEELTLLRQIFLAGKAPRHAEPLCMWCRDPTRKIHIHRLCRRCNSWYYDSAKDAAALGPSAPEFQLLFPDGLVALPGGLVTPSKPRTVVSGDVSNVSGGSEEGDDSDDFVTPPPPKTPRPASLSPSAPRMPVASLTGSKGYYMLANWDGYRRVVPAERLQFGRIPGTIRHKLELSSGVPVHVGSSYGSINFHVSNDRRVPKQLAVLEWNTAAKALTLCVMRIKDQPVYVNASKCKPFLKTPVPGNAVIQLGPLWFIVCMPE